MRRIKLFEEFAVDTEKAKFLAWIHLLDIYGKQGFSKTNWRNSDKRMGGMGAADAMHAGVKKGLVKDAGDKWLVTRKGEKSVDDFFYRPSLDQEKELADVLKSAGLHRTGLYDYPIDNIPLDLFHKKKEEYRKKTMHPSGKLTSEDISFITHFLERYQRMNEFDGHGAARMRNFAGLTNELIDNNDYTLWRGLHVSKEGKLGNVKVGDTVEAGGHQIASWTLSEPIAEQFAMGNPTPMEVSIDKPRFGDGQVGLILKHTFKPQDVIIDFDYVEEANPEFGGVINWPVEEEVLTKVNKGDRYEIIRVINK
jgi:hypothetical protein